MNKKIWVISAIVFIIFLISLFFLFLKPLTAGAKVLLFISEEFPQIPVKPLHLITQRPQQEYVVFGKDQKIIADIISPHVKGSHPALILSMAFRTQEKDKPLILGLADSLARLGYVTMWPRSQAIEDQVLKFEDPKVFAESFDYLSQRPEVDKKRISFVGFSAGSSIAMVAATDPVIADRVRSLLFFGGYYNLLDYFTAIASEQIIIDGRPVDWKPNDGAIDHAKEVLKSKGATLDVFKKGTVVSDEIKAQLIPYSPHVNIKNFKARLLILHDKADSSVPWVESEKLKKAAEAEVMTTYHITSLFEHIQPKKGFSPQILSEFAGLFGFLHQAFMYL